MSKTRTVSAERYLIGGAIVSVLVAAVCSLTPILSFGDFPTMAGVLVGSDIVIYALMKLGAFGGSSRL